MFLQVTELNFYDFINFSKNHPCNKTSQIRFNFIKLHIRYILNLATLLGSKLLEVSLRRRSNSNAAETFISLTAILMQMNFSHIIGFKVASYTACYLTNGDYIKQVLEKFTRESKVIATMKKWKCFQFQFK